MHAKLYLDTSYAIALANVNDQYHTRAQILANELETKDIKFITTRAVIIEIGNALAKLRYRTSAIRLIDSLEYDPTIEIIPQSEQLYKHAFQLYRKRLDKEWSLTDCISFIVMEDYGINEVLTTDVHFQQYGFSVRLREESR